jgi:hypothetical protein
VQRHGTSRQLQRTASGSTPHDRLTIRQICSSHSPPLVRPQQSAPRYPTVVANPPTIRSIRRRPSLIHEPLHRQPTCWIGSITINQLTRGTQIPIAPAARLYVPLSAVSSFGGFRTPAAEHAAPSLKRPASETLHRSGRLRRRPVTPFARRAFGTRRCIHAATIPQRTDLICMNENVCRVAKVPLILPSRSR